MSRRPHPDPEKAAEGITVDVQFMDYKTIAEEWSVWELEDSSRLRAKILLTEVFKALDPVTGEIILRPDGAPKYGANVSMTMVFEPSESAFVTKKVEEG